MDKKRVKEKEADNKESREVWLDDNTLNEISSDDTGTTKDDEDGEEEAT